MATDSGVLKEFLVRLGFKVDESSYKNFQSKLEKTTATFVELGKVGAIAGTAIVATLLKTTSDMTNLYYSAQRAGTSVRSLMGLRFGGAQVGIGAEQMASNVENMASILRSNPGMVAFFKQLGLRQLGDNAKNFENLITKLRQMDQRGGFSAVMARQIGAQFGFDEQTLTQLFANWPAFLQGEKDQAEALRAAGINAGELSKRSAEAQRNWNKFLMDVQLLVWTFDQKLLPFFDKAVVFLTRMIGAIDRVNKATGGWAVAIGGIVVAIGGAVSSLAILKGLGGLFGVAGAGEAAGAAAGAGGGLAAILTGPVVIAIVAAVAAVAVAWMAYHYRDQISRAVGGAYSAASTGISGFIAGFEGKSLSAYRDVAGHLTVGYGHLVKAGENFAGGISNSQAMQLLAQDTASAMATVKNLVRIPLNANQMMALTDFAYNVGSGNFARSTLLKDVNAGDFAGAASEFTRWDMAGGMHNKGLMNRRLGERALFQKPDVSMNQQTTIHVNGSADANETARQVASQQRKVNGDIIRDLAVKVQ